MIEQLTRRDFEGLPEGSLALDHEGRTLPMKVVELRDLPPVSPRAEPFAVVLAGPASPMLAQGIHTLLHPRHGRLELFVVPIARNGDCTRYEAVFN